MSISKIMELVLLFNMLMIRIIEFRRFDEGSEKKKRLDLRRSITMVKTKI